MLLSRSHVRFLWCQFRWVSSDTVLLFDFKWSSSSQTNSGIGPLKLVRSIPSFNNLHYRFTIVETLFLSPPQWVSHDTTTIFVFLLSSSSFIFYLNQNLKGGLLSINSHIVALKSKLHPPHTHIVKKETKYGLLLAGTDLFRDYVGLKPHTQLHYFFIINKGNSNLGLWICNE